METPGSKFHSPGTIVKKSHQPRSYVIESGGRLFRRNRKHLHKSQETAHSLPDDNWEDQFDQPTSAPEKQSLQIQDKGQSVSPSKGSPSIRQPPETKCTRLGRKVKALDRLNL